MLQCWLGKLPGGQAYARTELNAVQKKPDGNTACSIVIRCYTVFLRPEEIFGRHSIA